MISVVSVSFYFAANCKCVHIIEQDDLQNSRYDLVIRLHTVPTILCPLTFSQLNRDL